MTLRLYYMKPFINFSQTLEVATRFYLRALHLSKTSASLWHDLGLSYFRQYQYKAEIGGENEEETIHLAQQALAVSMK